MKGKATTGNVTNEAADLNDLAKFSASPDNLQANVHTEQLESIQNKLRFAEVEREQLKLQLGQLENSVKKPTPKKWWATSIEFLALPGAILAIVLQLTNVSDKISPADKTNTVITNTEILKSIVKSQNLLDDLVTKQKSGTVANNKELENGISEIRKNLTLLQNSQSGALDGRVARSIAKYVLLWVLFHAIGLCFDIIFQVWSTLLQSISNVIYNLKFKGEDGRTNYDKRDKFISYYRWVEVIIRPVPNILRWSLQLSIFITLMIPLFNELASTLGASSSFETVLAHAKKFEISEALALMRLILFGSGTGSSSF
ncbi:hypothetical protein [Dyadobacter bucti]|uniref:hypothetical protein n=1 Tax=Dyadobacter bucti TaxID=2572203 RepID=UPI003F711F4D